MYKSPIWTAVGYAMLALGFLSLCLSLVGLKLWPMVYIDRWSPLGGLLFKFFLILAGIIIMVLSKIDWDKERKTLDQ